VCCKGRKIAHCFENKGGGDVPTTIFLNMTAWQSYYLIVGHPPPLLSVLGMHFILAI